jgi:hypothetical protein
MQGLDFMNHAIFLNGHFLHRHEVSGHDFSRAVKAQATFGLQPLLF